MFCYSKHYKMEYYKIKFKQEDPKASLKDKDKWFATIFYPFKQPVLPRTIGYMTQSSIDALPTRKEIIMQLKSQGKIYSL